MTHLEAVFLGILQGVTEFLPVSSSGHLVVAQGLFRLREPQLLFDVSLHVATAGAVVIFYRRAIGAILRDLCRQWGKKSLLPGVRTALLLALGSVATVVVYLAAAGPLLAAFGAPRAAGAALLVNALALAASRLNPRRRPPAAPLIALLIGLAQGLALVPGLSRSGLTIVTALLLGQQRERAVEFSMLLSLPAIAGAMLLQLGGAETNSAAPSPALLAAGAAAAFLCGLLALRLLVKLARNSRLYLFAPYCAIVGAVVLATSNG